MVRFRGDLKNQIGLKILRNYMTYLLTAIGLTPGGSITVHNYTQTIHRTTQITTKLGRVRAVPRLLRILPWDLPYNCGKSTEKP